MNHHDATQTMALEKYVLSELTPELRAEFEEHYFECAECAMDLRATTAFLDAAKAEFKTASAIKRLPVAVPKTRGPWPWRPAFIMPALAACLLLIAYQNAVVVPQLHQKIAQFNSPEVVPSVPLVGGDSRGGQIPMIAVPPAHPFLLLLDIPTQDRFSSYTCSLYSPTGQLAWMIQVPAHEAKDTISITVPTADRMDGRYSLDVQGNAGPSNPGSSVDVARYSFVLKTRK
ncbi:MAG: anti-sigma factor family protein [Acidobacteriaceae bacterium]